MKYSLLNIELSIGLDDPLKLGVRQSDAVAGLTPRLAKLGISVLQTKVTTIGPSDEPLNVERENQ